MSEISNTHCRPRELKARKRRLVSSVFAAAVVVMVLAVVAVLLGALQCVLPEAQDAATRFPYARKTPIKLPSHPPIRSLALARSGVRVALPDGGEATSSVTVLFADRASGLGAVDVDGGALITFFPNSGFVGRAVSQTTGHLRTACHAPVLYGLPFRTWWRETGKYAGLSTILEAVCEGSDCSFWREASKGGRTANGMLTECLMVVSRGHNFMWVREFSTESGVSGFLYETGRRTIEAYVCTNGYAVNFLFGVGDEGMLRATNTLASIAVCTGVGSE